jgi:hypothetical protein
VDDGDGESGMYGELGIHEEESDEAVLDDLTEEMMEVESV